MGAYIVDRYDTLRVLLRRNIICGNQMEEGCNMWKRWVCMYRFAWGVE